MNAFMNAAPGLSVGYAFAALAVLLSGLAGCVSEPPAPEVSEAPREGVVTEAETAAFEARGFSLKRYTGAPGVVLRYALVPAGNYGAAFRLFETSVGEGAAQQEPGAWAFESEWGDLPPLLLPPIGTLVFLHREPLDLRLSLALAAWFASFGFDGLIVDLRAYGLLAREDLIDDRGEGAAVSAVLDAAQELGLSPGPVALVGYALGGFTAVYAAASDPRIGALAMLAPPLEDDTPARTPTMGGAGSRLPAGVGVMVRGRARLRAETRIRSEINRLDIVQAARQVQACTVLVQRDSGEAPNSRLVAEIKRVMPRFQLAPVAGTAPVPELALLPDYGTALADWLDLALHTGVGEECPKPAWTP